MATPIGHINGKAVYGPPRPPSPAPASPVDSGLGLDLTGLPVQTSEQSKSLGPEFFLGYTDGYIPFCSFRYREQLIHPLGNLPHLTCPATCNGWNTERGERLFDGLVPTGSKTSSGLFDKLPRELRDRIYTAAVLLPITDAMLGENGDAAKPTSTMPELVRQSRVDLTMETGMIFPGGTRSDCSLKGGPAGGKAISDNLGLLLANKQLHNEASKVLYSSNTFGILIDTERPRHRGFWNCNLPACDAPKSPCLIAPRNIRHLKYLMIAIQANEEFHPWDECYEKEMIKLRNRISDVVKVLIKHDVKLKVLSVKFANTFGGRLGEFLSGPLANDIRYPHDDYQIPIWTAMGCVIHLTRTPNEEYFEGSQGYCCPVDGYSLLDPLLKLRGRAEYFKLRGDFPSKYLNGIRDAMNKDANPSIPIQIIKTRDETFNRQRSAFRKVEEHKYRDEMEVRMETQMDSDDA